MTQDESSSEVPLEGSEPTESHGENLIAKKMKRVKSIDDEKVEGPYGPPEGATIERSYSNKVDMWSVGKIFAELLTHTP